MDELPKHGRSIGCQARSPPFPIPSIVGAHICQIPVQCQPDVARLKRPSGKSASKPPIPSHRTLAPHLLPSHDRVVSDVGIPIYTNNLK
jgi:hypothetical protein